MYLSLAPNINKIKQAKIKIGKILVGEAIKENVTCICVWDFYKNDLRRVGKKWKQKTKIVETEKLKGENKIKRCIKLLWKVFVNSNNNLLFDKALKNYLNAVMWC